MQSLSVSVCLLLSLPVSLSASLPVCLSACMSACLPVWRAGRLAGGRDGCLAGWQDSLLARLLVDWLADWQAGLLAVAASKVSLVYTLWSLSTFMVDRVLTSPLDSLRETRRGTLIVALLA